MRAFRTVPCLMSGIFLLAFTNTLTKPSVVQKEAAFSRDRGEVLKSLQLVVGNGHGGTCGAGQSGPQAGSGQECHSGCLKCCGKAGAGRAWLSLPSWMNTASVCA